MTEAEWLACEDPERMLAFLQGKASDRKLRLFACALARGGFLWLDNVADVAALEVAERHANGAATPDELRAAHVRAPRLGAKWATEPDARSGALMWAGSTARPPAALCRLLRDIIAPPFRAYAIDPRWL